MYSCRRSLLVRQGCHAGEIRYLRYLRSSTHDRDWRSNKRLYNDIAFLPLVLPASVSQIHSIGDIYSL